MNNSGIIAVACESADGLAGNVSGHFGHTPYFAVAELADGNIVASRLVASPGHGQGCSMPAFVESLGARAIIVGGIGAGAVNGLRARGIEIAAGATGSAEAALRSYASGTLPEAQPGCGGHGGHGHNCNHG
jgi:predicted Fe-Mo cluster-binding NifX family protein